MKYLKEFSGLYLTVILFITPGKVFSQNDGNPVLWLSFDKINIDEELHFRTVEDKATNQVDTIKGTYMVLKDGVQGKSLLLDGYSAYLKAVNIPPVTGSFSVEAWIALGAYPTNYCPVAEQISIEEKGFSFGINYEGKAYFKIATLDGWVNIASKEKIPLLNWTHICGVYDTKSITLYINGGKVAQKESGSTFLSAPGEIFYSGITSQKSLPKGILTPRGSQPVTHFFDGLIDELKVWDKALTEKDFDPVIKKVSKISKPALEKRPLPELPGQKRFGAIYANLKYYESWDNFWRVSGLPDVVVTFEKGGHFVFWRGTSYIPHWVTENGIWYDNEFNETWSSRGCHEPMSDKRCEHSQVKILENTPARCVVQWRYALVDNWYNLSNIDPLTGQGDWTDEIYTIYPDGVAVRSQTLHSSNLSSSFEWHEGIIVMGQGQGPEDVLYPEALTLANMDGKEHVYSWEPVDTVAQEGVTYVINKKDKWLTELPEANIQRINTRSELKPFTIVNPDDNPKWDFYKSRSEFSMFPCWNHWPTAFKPSDGRYAYDKDRASHSSLTHVREWKPYKKTEYSETRLMLVGLTKGKAADLVPLTQSWSHAPKMTVEGENIVNLGYDLSERAYRLKCLNPEECNNFSMRLKCTPEFPFVNPAFVIENFGSKEFELKINGDKVTDENLIRHDLVKTLTSSNLILWIKKKSDNPVNIEIYRN